MNLSTRLIYGFKEKKSRKHGASFQAGAAGLGCVSPELPELSRWPASESARKLAERQSLGPPTELVPGGSSLEFGGWTLWCSILISMSDKFYAH